MSTATTTLTIDAIRTAQGNDIESAAALSEILEATASRVDGLAAKAAHRMAATGDRLESYREEFAQVGRIAVWEALPRFTGETVDSFYAFVYSTVESKLMDAARWERNGAAGADKDAVIIFGSALEEAKGDVYLAEKLAQTSPPKGKRLSADRANAARLSWQGTIYLDRPTESGSDSGYAVSQNTNMGSVASTLAFHDETPNIIRPKVGTGAALEALAVLHRYSSAYEALAALPAGPEDVDAIEAAITVPRDPEVRRYVLDAIAILRSYVSTVADGDLAADLRDVSDDRRDERAVKRERVNTALARMGAGQRDVLVHSFGIGDVDAYGWGAGCDLEGLAERLCITAQNAKVQRSKGLVAFAKHYIALVARTADEALAWAAGAAEMRKPAGRK